MSGLDKGMPLARSTEQALGASLLREELPLPVCTLRNGALRVNSQTLRAFLAAVADETDADIVLCPHGKTTMSPALFRRQLDDGCWGITLATIHQVRVARRFGVPRILLANQLVGRHEIDWVLRELRDNERFAFACLVDSTDGVQRLAERAAATPTARPLDVLVEAGYRGGRCGVRSITQGLEVARAAHAAAPALRLVGIEAYEGLLQTQPPAQSDARAAEVVSFVAELAEACDRDGLFDQADPILLSAGGSSFFDLAARILADASLSKPTRIVVRSGCYLTHDTGLYEPLVRRLAERDPAAQRLGLAFTPALEVWAAVLSVPEPGLAILGVGRRDFGEDSGPPALARHVRDGGQLADATLASARIRDVNDQHAIVEVPDDADIRVGDVVTLSPAHPAPPSTSGAWCMSSTTTRPSPRRSAHTSEHPARSGSQTLQDA